MRVVFVAGCWLKVEAVKPYNHRANLLHVGDVLKKVSYYYFVKDSAGFFGRKEYSVFATGYWMRAISCRCETEKPQCKFITLKQLFGGSKLSLFWVT